MTHTLRQTAVAAVIGGALAFAPTRAAALPSPAAATETQQEKARTLEDLNRDVNEINRKLTRLTEMLEGRKDASGYVLPSDRGLLSDLKDLKDRVDKLERQLNDPRRSTSFRDGGVADPLAGKGTVRVVNEYPVMVSIRVNGVSHRVEPNEKKDILVPAGEFQYELLTAGAGMTRSVIREKETVTLRIK